MFLYWKIQFQISVRRLVFEFVCFYLKFKERFMFNYVGTSFLVLFFHHEKLLNFIKFLNNLKKKIKYYLKQKKNKKN